MDKVVSKNLIYFIWWNNDNGMLMYNLELLERYIDLFDNKTIKIADGKKNDIPGFLRGAQIVTNYSNMGEVPHFKHSLEEIQGGITFYGHAKGISRKTNNPLKWWVKQLYQGNLESEPNLDDYLVSGCFGKLRVGSRNVPVPWHYSGSFFWFTEEVLGRYKKTSIPRGIDNRWFTENFCGWLVDKEEAEFRLYSSDELRINCYSEDFWQKNKHLIP